MSMVFKRAERQQAKLRLAIWGPSGSGKTYGALKIAAGLGGKVAVIDSERGSASLYADVAAFDVLELAPPFSPARYVEAIEAAAQAGYSVVVIDSLSHAWSGAGGVLEMVDAAQAKARNQFSAWRDVTPEHNGLVDALLQTPIHLIATLRTKTAYEVADNDKGKKAPVKIGLAPIQRDGLEYEFTACLELSVEKHVAWATKDRTRIFGEQPFVISEDTGRRLASWLAGGVAPASEAPDLRRIANMAARVQALVGATIDMGAAPRDVAARVNAAAGAQIVGEDGSVRDDQITHAVVNRYEPVLAQAEAGVKARAAAKAQAAKPAEPAPRKEAEYIPFGKQKEAKS